MREYTQTKWIFAILIMILPIFIYLIGEKSEITYAEQNPDEVEIIVQYKTDADSDEINIHGDKNIKELEKITVKKEELEETLEKLQMQDHVLYVEEDVSVEIHGQPNDMYYSEQWYIGAIGADEAWKKSSVADETITVAVIDTGVDANHVDLKGKVLAGYNFLENNTNTADVNGHGTAVAGIIAAIYNNQVGISGITGDAEVQILPLKVAGNDGKGKVSDMVEAIFYAMEYGVDVINISMGTSNYSTILEDAIESATSKDIVVVASAGNDGTSEKEYPASYPSVISVGSVSKKNTLSTFSNYNEQVDFVAPGESILTTSPNDLLKYYNGTSFSSAVVSGAAAYILATDPTMSSDILINKLEETATDLGPTGKDQQYGYGLINLARAVTEQKAAAIPEKYKELESLKINGNDFYLQIKFTTGIDSVSINEDTVFILDEYGEKIDVQYQFESNNEKVNVITDPVNYKMGKSYYLFVDQGVKSNKGRALNQPIVIQFMWDEEAGTLMLNQEFGLEVLEKIDGQ